MPLVVGEKQRNGVPTRDPSPLPTPEAPGPHLKRSMREGMRERGQDGGVGRSYWTPGEGRGALRLKFWW